MSQPPPPPQEVASAEPAPYAQERDPDSDADPEQIAKQKRKGARQGKASLISAQVPPAPPSGERGFTSTEPPGRTLSPLEAVRWRSKQAFDELDQESERYKSRSGN